MSWDFKEIEERKVRLYGTRQSSQISAQTGLIGYLTGEKNGNEFLFNWYDVCMSYQLEGFKEELHALLSCLQEEKSVSGFLKDARTLSKWCHSHPKASDERYREFFFRADTEQYACIARLLPEEDFCVYMYVYRREWLEKHLKAAERGIRFITPDYKDLFRLPDGNSIKICRPNGLVVSEVCRYIDETHLEVGRWIYHICEFAEMMERNGNTVEPIPA